MPRAFDVSVQSAATVEQVHQAFGQKDYWRDRFVEFDTRTVLDTLAVDAAGVVRIAMSQDLRHDGLPRPIARFYPGDLKVLSTETWAPTGAGQVHGEVVITVVGAPGSGRGAARLVRRGSGSQLSFNGTVEFNVPLLGGRIESYLSRQFTEHIPDIQRFTTEWIKDRM